MQTMLVDDDDDGIALIDKKIMTIPYMPWPMQWHSEIRFECSRIDFRLAKLDGN